MFSGVLIGPNRYFTLHSLHIILKFVPHTAARCCNKQQQKTPRAQPYRSLPISCTRCQAYSSFFWKAGARWRVRRRPRPLSAIGHSVGPPWSTFTATRWSQRSATARIGNREILEGISIIVSANASRFFRGCYINLTSCDGTPPHLEINLPIWKNALR